MTTGQATVILVTLGALIALVCTIPAKINRERPASTIEQAAEKFHVQTIETQIRCYQTDVTKATVDGHEWLIFGVGGNGMNVIHAPSCTNCALRADSIQNIVSKSMEIITK